MTKRIDPRELDPAGGSPGQVPTINAAGTALEYADPGAGSGVVETIVAGTGIAVDSTDPANPVVSATGGGGGGTTELAYAQYYPAAAAVLSTTSTSLVDAHADLAVTFTAPASGNVTVTLNGVASASVNGGAAYWALREGSATVPNSQRLAASVVTSDRAHVPIRVSGLTPGASYTYKWAHRTFSSSYASKIISGPDADGDYGPASMTVTAR